MVTELDLTSLSFIADTMTELEAQIVLKGLSAEVCGLRESRALRELEPQEIGDVACWGVEFGGGGRATSSTPGEKSPGGRIFTFTNE